MSRDFFGDLYIVMIYAEVTMLCLLSFYFLNYIWKKKGVKQNAINFSLTASTFFLSFAAYKFFSMIYHFYYTLEGVRVAGRIILLGGVLLTIFTLNRGLFKQIFKSDLIRQIYFIVVIVATIILTELYYIYSNLEILFVLLLILSLLTAVLFISSVRWFKNIGHFIRKNMIQFLIGGIIFMFGASLTRILLYIPEFYFYLFITNGLEIWGIAIMSWGILNVSELIELDWKSDLIHLYIIHNSGLVILERKFRGEDDVNPVLAEGGITGITTALREMTKSDERLSIIRQGDRNILVEYGEYVNVVLIVEKELEIYRHKMSELLNKFEQTFKDILEAWKGGNRAFFRPADLIIDEIFQ